MTCDKLSYRVFFSTALIILLNWFHSIFIAEMHRGCSAAMRAWTIFLCKLSYIQCTRFAHNICSKMFRSSSTLNKALDEFCVKLGQVQVESPPYLCFQLEAFKERYARKLLEYFRVFSFAAKRANQYLTGFFGQNMVISQLSFLAVGVWVSGSVRVCF